MGSPPTPPRKLNAAELFDSLEIDLWGHVYTLRPVTRSVSARIDALQERAGELTGDDREGDATTDDLTGTLIELIDVMLQPVDDGDDAGPLLRDMWDEDKLGLDWINAFVESLQEESAARRRPTSRSKTRG